MVIEKNNNIRFYPFVYYFPQPRTFCQECNTMHEIPSCGSIKKPEVNPITCKFRMRDIYIYLIRGKPTPPIEVEENEEPNNDVRIKTKLFLCQSFPISFK